jgi:plastocyanin
MQRLSNSPRRAPIATALALALAAPLFASSTAPAATGRSPVPAGRAKAAKVEVEDLSFRPGTLRVPRGTKVVFANRDRVSHTATGHGFDTGTIRPGHAAAVRFNHSGTFRYVCTIHPFMHGKIVVR